MLSKIKSMRLLLALLCAVVLGVSCRRGTPTPATEQSAALQLADALAKLGPEDHYAAKEQRICPVSGKDLGSMGTPIKVSQERKDLFLCCDACVEPFRQEPQKYLAKLKQ